MNKTVPFKPDRFAKSHRLAVFSPRLVNLAADFRKCRPDMQPRKQIILAVVPAF